MANEIMKEIKTRIALKTLDLAGWEAIKDTYKPLKGEVCVCEIPSGNVLTANSVTPPTVLFKVGDGSHFWSELNWASALAADVYSWAKKSQDEFIEWVNTVVEHPAAPKITTGSENGTIAVDGADVAVKGLGSAAYTESGAYATSEQGTKADNAAAAIATYGDIVTHNASEFATKEQGDKADSAVQSVALAGGTNDGTLKLTVDGTPVDNIAVTGLKGAAYVTVESLNTTAKGYADDVQSKLTIYENAHIIDYTNSKIDELVQGAKDYAAGLDDANTEYHVEYDSTNKKIKLVAGADASKMEIDATDFIKDGMIESVELVAEDDGGNKGQFLKITWNTDGNVDADDVTYVNVTTLVDVYVGENGDYVNVTVTSDNKIKADLTDAAKEKLNGDYKIKQAAVPDQGLTGAKVLASLSQNENGVISYSTRDLTPADIGAQPAGNYKTVQEEVVKTGSTVKTVTEIKQDTNGKITEVKFEDIAFPECVASGSATIASVSDDVVTLKTGAVLNADHTLANDTGTDITLAKVAKTGSIYDVAEASKTDDDVVYLLLDCNW